MAALIKTLEMRFDSPAALRAEFEKNIVNRGIFVATDDELEVRQVVEVAIVLGYPVGDPAPVVLRGEVVHRVLPAMVTRGGRPGVAVQFEETVQALRERFTPLLGSEPLADPDVDREGARRRSAPREPVRVPIEVQVGPNPPVLVTTRDLSGSGVLLSTRDQAFVVGEAVRIRLSSPERDGDVRIAGRVVREVKNQRGEVAAVAVAFDAKQAADPRVRAQVARLREASHRGRLGEVSGSIGSDGIAGLLQTFAGSMPSGTLVVERAGEQGFVAFAKDRFVAAEVGPHSGARAVEELLGWTSGRFELEARVDPARLAKASGESLSAVLLEAACARDADESAAPNPASSGPARRVLAYGPATIFQVDDARVESAQDGLSKTEQAVLDLARAGMSVARIREVIPEPAARIDTALASLLEQGVLLPRGLKQGGGAGS